MNRLRFEKRGDAVWISHLDLMRVFQRAFRRAGELLKHTGGFNQHAYVSLALPLSVGTASGCEILDFELEGPKDNLKERLNQVLPAGIRVLEVYDSDRKLKELTHLHAKVYLEYDAGIPEGTEAGLTELFSRDSLVVEKKTKRGFAEIDLIPMIQRLDVLRLDNHTLELDTVVCAQNPSLNPSQLLNAISVHTPTLCPDFTKYERIEVLMNNGMPFR